MKVRLAIVPTLAALCLAADSERVHAQSNQCPPGALATDTQRITQDACQLAVDLFHYMAPQLGLAVTGGNATLGQGGTLGGLGKILIGARANVLRGSLPQVDDLTVSATGRVQRTGDNAIATDDAILGLPTIDAAVGLFKGIPAGVTNVGGVDLLVSVGYMPNIDTDPLDVSVDSPFSFGFGARVGIMQESILIPGVAFTILQRRLPQSTVTGVTGTGDSLVVRDLDVKTTAWRIVASKSFLTFGLAAGIGQDDYRSSADISATVHTPITGLPVRTGPTSTEQSMKRNNMFLDLSLNILPATRLLLEIGRVSGGDVTSFNEFSGSPPDAPRIYGALGLRIGL